MQIYTLEWKAEYETGVGEIDLQHRYFMSLINRLSAELDSCDDASYRRSLLDELAKYAVFHFVSEENLMLKFGYTGLERQRLLHRELIDQLSWRMQSASYDDLFAFLISWFIHHTVEEDHDIGDFVRKGDVG